MKTPRVIYTILIPLIAFLIVTLFYVGRGYEEKTGCRPGEEFTKKVGKSGFVIVGARPSKVNGFFCVQYTD